MRTSNRPATAGRPAASASASAPALAPALTLALALTAAAAPALAQQPNAAADAPPPAAAGETRQTRVTPAIRAQIYDRLGEAQTLIEAGDTAGALEALERLAAARDLNPYERASLLNLKAAAHFDQDDFAAASAAYEEMLALPHEEITDGFVQTAMRNLASTYWSMDRLPDALRVLDDWFALPSTVPDSRDWYSKGVLHYQLDDYPDGISALEEAIRIETDKGGIGEENWYQLLAAMYSEQEETAKTIEILSIMVLHWTNRANMLQLAGQLSQADRQVDALTLIEAAWEAGWLESNSDVTTLAALYMNAGTPFKAAQVMSSGLDQGIVDSNDRNWMLLGQAWHAAHEYVLAVDAFAEASERSEDGRADSRRAISLALLGRWQECVDAARLALERGDPAGAEYTQIRLGECHFNLKQFDEAEAAFEEAEKSERTRSAARAWLSFNLSQRNTVEYLAEELRLQLELNAAKEAEGSSAGGGPLSSAAPGATPAVPEAPDVLETPVETDGALSAPLPAPLPDQLPAPVPAPAIARP